MSGVISQFPCRAKNQPTAILKRQSKDSKPFKDKAVVEFLPQNLLARDDDGDGDVDLNDHFL